MASLVCRTALGCLAVVLLSSCGSSGDIATSRAGADGVTPSAAVQQAQRGGDSPGGQTAVADPVDTGSTTLYVGYGSFADSSGRRFVLLLPGSRILQEYPVEGPADLAPDSVQSAAGPGAGRYTVGPGGRLEVQWSDGQGGTGAVDGPNLRLYDQGYQRVLSPADGSLNGTFGQQSGGTGATITFTSDGRFDDEGITSQTGVSTSERPSGTGTYRIRDYTLFLDYDDGSTQRFGIYLQPEENPSAPDQFDLAGYDFVRR